MTLYSMFHTVLTMSFMGTITALVILFFKKIFKRSISPNWHYFIWIILLLRLIIPYVPESSFSIFNFFTHYNQACQEIQSPVIHNKNYNSVSSNNIQSMVDSNNLELFEIKSTNEENLQTNFYDKHNNQNQYLHKENFNILNIVRNQNSYLPFKYKNVPRANSKNLPHILGIIWIIGVFVSSSYIILLQISFNLKIRKFHRCTKENTLSNYYRCKSQMKIKKKVPLIVDSKIKTPSLIGVFNPKILISPNYIDLLTDEELKFVFMHELAHYKRKDIIIRWVFIFLQILHWFNPILWFAFYKARQDCEAACDYYVLSCLKPHEYKKYGSTMIKMLDIFSGYNYIPGATSMLDGKKFIIERVKNIINFKKPYVKWTLLGAALFIALTAFLLTNGKEPPKEVVKIKYTVEKLGENLELDSIKGLESISNEKFLTYDRKNHKFVILNNDGTKDKSINFEDSTESTSPLFTVDSKNNLYVLSTIPSPRVHVFNLMGNKIAAIDLEDTDIANVDNLYGWDLEVDSKGNIYVMTADTNIQIFDSKGSKIKTINKNGCLFIELDEEDNLYIGGFNKNYYVLKQSPLNDNILWKIENDSKFVSIKSAAYSKQSKSLYVANFNNIINISSDGKSINTHLNIDSMVDNESFIFEDLTFDSNENIYFCGLDSTNYESLLYKANTNKINVDSTNIKTITITVGYLDSVLEYAINKFENQHPDVIINVENYDAVSFVNTDMTYEESLKAEEEGFKKEYDFIQKLNTQMLTGKGGDIIQVSSIPYRKYADKGLLLDLKELMSKDASFDKNLYYTNIFDAMEYKDKLYTVPLTIYYSAFLANEDFLNKHSFKIDDDNWTWKDFLDVSRKVTMDIDRDGKNDMYSMPTIIPENLFNYLLSSNSKSFIDYENKKAYFTSKEFINLLKICDAMSSGSFVNSDITEASMDNRGCVFVPYSISDFTIFFSNSFLNTDKVALYKYPNLDNDVTTFSAYNMYGINSNTKHKEEAWEFIKFLLSEEVQSYKMLYGIPINKNARENKIQHNFEEAKDSTEEFGNIYGYNVTEPLKIQNQFKNNIEKINEIVPKLNNCNTYDIQIQKVLNEEIKNFFNGNKSAEETAKIIQRKVEMYLNE
ncbi:extracellular solute-binding protein [Maledivibacter halophilus]|uniref:Antirepressor regulating drug resistance, predicted signal transduction N-terminal membrane component n=1 Tax=Maledivibacter halophilus TaxID=36842 RepID=A0A1T5ILW0_9FIRM|nr:extracellular solute-binding protein [Maledivibacter halophilus]SKC40100.1 Antirepressor regulating drug resistance, predicted signal transduction N-terminal membrane component [Maledivibacter halophilus]